MRSQVAEGARLCQRRTQPTLYNTSSVPSCLAVGASPHGYQRHGRTLDANGALTVTFRAVPSVNLAHLMIVVATSDCTCSYAYDAPTFTHRHDPGNDVATTITESDALHPSVQIGAPIVTFPVH